MKLTKITYEQFHGRTNEWKIETLLLDNINLIVGRNGCGKTKTLNIISGLAKLLAGEIKLTLLSGYYDVLFENDNKEIHYILHYEDKQVVSEFLSINNETLLDRGEGGVGEIYAVELKKPIKFQTPVSELTSWVRRDSIQHPFFEDLFQWGNNFNHYNFGSQLGKDHLIPKDVILKDLNLNTKDTNQVIRIFKKGCDEFPDVFEKNIITDMHEIGYNIRAFEISPLKSIIIQTNYPSEIVGLNVYENDLNDITDQNDMSQGMFRALSLLIQINYSFLSGQPNCILIDDIGEGLDYERSTALIKLLISKIKNTSTQLVMSTNDRFIMNHVPLEYWSIISRTSGCIKFYNYFNSKDIFNDFEKTGLNNFDLFTSNYYLNDRNKH